MCTQLHKDFKGLDITQEQVLFAMMTADCTASAAGTPYFQTLVIEKDGMNHVFARADPGNLNVAHSISQEGFRVAAPTWNKAGNNGKWGPPLSPATTGRGTRDQGYQGWGNYLTGGW